MSAMNLDQGEGGQDFELNIVPIIDCFTVLIAYLLVSASFLSLAAFDVGVAVSGEGAVTEEQLNEAPFSLTVKLLQNRGMEVNLVGGPERINSTQTLNSKSGKWDLEGLKNKMADLKTKYAKISEVNVNAEGPVNYKEIIQAIEKIKPSYPKVYLAGSNEKQIQQ